MRFLLLLILIAGVAGFFTRPDANAHWATVANLIRDGDVDGGQLSERQGRYENFYVASRYTFLVGGKERAQCWGAFTRFLCLGPSATPTVELPAVSGGAPPS
jgi:hypothetical protein